MSKIGNAIHEIHFLDTMADRDQWVNKLHPLVKFILTLAYICTVVSFSRYDVIGLLGMAVYPAAMFILAELSVRDSLRRLRIVLPLVCFVGVFNPFFDKVPVFIGNLCVRAGVLSMITLMLKGVLSVLASYLLIATTSIEKICYALGILHVPKVMITQIMLTYRYVTLLLGEVNRITQAYALRAPRQKGIHFKVWGSLTGQLLLRSMDWANAVYESMVLRGYSGDFQYIRKKNPLKAGDVLYLALWAAVFFVFRRFPVILVIGNVIGGAAG